MPAGCRRTTAVLAMLSGLDMAWRLLATAVSYLVFGCGAVVLTLLWLPLSCLCRKPIQRRRLAQAMIRSAFRLFLSLLRGLGVISYRILGQERLQQDHGCLLVANHPSLLDYVLLASLLPQCDCIVKRALWRNPFVGGIVRAAGYIPNADPDELIPACQARLQLGGVLLIFPEGTRSTPGAALRLQRGAAHLALRCQVDVRLAHIACEPATLTKHTPWYRVPRRKPHFEVRIGERVAIAPFLAAAQPVPLAARTLTGYLTRALTPPAQNSLCNG